MYSTHVRVDGTPKAVYESEAEAREVADRMHAAFGVRQFPYECWMKPPHWHLTKRQPKLETR